MGNAEIYRPADRFLTMQHQSPTTEEASRLEQSSRFYANGAEADGAGGGFRVLHHVAAQQGDQLRIRNEVRRHSDSLGR